MCSSDLHPRTVIDEQPLAQPRTRMNLDACQKTRVLRQQTRQNESPAPIQPVRYLVEENRVQTRVAQQNLQAALSRGIFPFDSAYVVPQ